MMAVRPIDEEVSMITGAHVVIFTKDAEGLRSFFRDVLGFVSVDAGGGWLIFALPPAELAAPGRREGPS
jgi:catechol 2,3-dioxygenase-like lactoylglutathione lyase family enzyme